MAIILFLLIPGCTVLLHRLYHGRLWFLKIWHVGGGNFIIPNSVIAFLLCQGCFGFLWISNVIVSVQYYHRNPTFQKNFFLWRILIWTPLWLGGWLSGFGVLSAFPEALTYQSKKGGQKRLILSHSAFNVACWFVPLVLIATILPLAIITAREYNHAFDNFEAWRQLVDVSQQSALSDTAFAVLKAQALKLWLDVTRAYWYHGIAMTCWCCWAVLCLLTYMPLGAHTLSRIRAQLRQAKRKEKTSVSKAPFPFQPPVIRIEVPTIQESQVQSNKGLGTTVENDTVQTRAPCNDQQQTHLQVGSKVTSTRGGLQPLGDQRGDGVGTTSSRVFPPNRMPEASRPSKFRTMEQRRIHSLERVYRNISIQYSGICIAILCFFSSSMVLAAHSYDSARQNTIGSNSVLAALSAAYPINVFGFLSVGCIFWRSFDPALSIDVSDDGPTSSPARSALGKFKKRALRLSRLGGKVASEGEDGTVTIHPDTLESESSINLARSGSMKELERTYSSHTRTSTLDRFPAKLKGLQCDGPVPPKRRRGISSLPVALIGTQKLDGSSWVENLDRPESSGRTGPVEMAPATVSEDVNRILRTATPDDATSTTESGAQAVVSHRFEDQRNVEGSSGERLLSNPSRASIFKQVQRVSSMISISSANTFAAGPRRSQASRPESPTLTDGFELSSRPESYIEAAARVSSTSNGSFSYDLEQGLRQYCEHAEQAALPRQSFGIESVLSHHRTGSGAF